MSRYREGRENEPWGKPSVPPAIKKKGEVKGRFWGWLSELKVDAMGRVTVKLGIPDTEKYSALALSEMRGVALYFEVFEPPVEEDDFESLIALLEGENAAND